MTDPYDPTGSAAVWQQAADRVAALRHVDLDGDASLTWNDALDGAVAALEKEASDIRATAKMAHLLITGNVVQSPGVAVQKNLDEG